MKKIIYKTKSIDEAAAQLLEMGQIDIIEKDGDNYIFIFFDGKICKKTADKYYSGRLFLDALEYSHTLSELMMEIEDM